tara:strand:+ start:258 stop:554 length:297 start_codon:yes stop_codon:yes gene_type:complete
MSKTAFSKKCEILGGVWFFYKDNELDAAWEEFFAWADVSLPLAYMLFTNVVSLKTFGEGDRYIEEAWSLLCELLGVDPDASYSDLEDFFEQPLANNKP